MRARFVIVSIAFASLIAPGAMADPPRHAGSSSPPSSSAPRAVRPAQLSPLDAARACRGDDLCVVRALVRPRTEQECRMLAVTLDVMGRRVEARQALEECRRRFPGRIIPSLPEHDRGVRPPNQAAL